VYPLRRGAVLLIVGTVLLAGCAGPAGPGGTETPGPGDPSAPTETAGESTNSTVEVHNINVGQSTSTLIIGPTGETMLIDTGDFNNDGEHVLAYLQRHDITRIDHLVVTHNDADHIGGNAAIIEYYETEADGVGAIYDPGIAASTNTYNGVVETGHLNAYASAKH
jgi:competence protein ComEC